MGESTTQAQAWVRRGSNPKLEEVIQIPPETPPNHGEGKYYHYHYEGGIVSKTLLSLLYRPWASMVPSLYHGWSSSVTYRAPALASISVPRTTLVIASWYASNIGVLLLNKYLLSSYGFRYPIFLTMLHMCACSCYSYLAVSCLAIVPRQPISSCLQLFKLASLSLIFSFSVVCGNASLRYLPVSFNQAIGATTPFFTAIFAVIITCKRESNVVYMALIPVVLGIVVASRSEPLFHLLGFLLCLGSTAGRALKSVVQGILLTSEAEKLHSMNLLLYMAPISGLILLPFTLMWEGNMLAITVKKAQDDPCILFFLFANMTMAYLVNLTNFLVTKHTSALTLQVLGNAKAAVAATVSILIFQNPVTIMGMTGFIITILGVIMYSEAKKRFRPSY